MASSPAKPHVILFPYAAQGHMNPMIQLSKKLAAEGVHTTLVTTEYNVARILKAQHNSTGSAAEEVVLDDVRLIGLPDGLPPNCDRNLMNPDAAVAIDNMGGVADELLQKLVHEQPPITCIIGDCFVSWMRDVANKHNIPRVVFWPLSAAVFATYSHVNQIISNGFNPFEVSVINAVKSRQPMDLVTCIPGLSPLHPADLPFLTTFGEPGLQWNRNFIENQFGHLDEVVCVIGNTFYELEPHVCKALQIETPNMHAIGPLLPSAFLHEENVHDTRWGLSLWEEDNCCEWLDMQPVSSVLYVSFGSLARLSVAQIHEIALGLAASQQRFLWVIRKGAIVEEVTNVLEALPEGFLDQIKDQGKLIHWAPQVLVLSHPAVGGYFSHCGWTSTLESISMGVPLLGWPHMMDQVTHCWFIANEWKIGLELKMNEENKTDRGEVEKAVRILMEGQEAEEIRSRAAKLRDAARWAVKKGSGSSDKNFQLFVADLIRRSRTKLL